MQLSDQLPMRGKHIHKLLPWSRCKGNCPRRCREGSLARKAERRSERRRENQAFQHRMREEER